MYAVRYHGCTCHQRYSQNQQQKQQNGNEYDNGSTVSNGNANSEPVAEGEMKPQPWYFHVVASLILVVHGITFLVPQDMEEDDTDMVRTVAKWFGHDMEWVKPYTPYAQGLAAVFNISLGIVSWWTSKESDRYNRLIQLRVFAFCLNILHAYITGPIIYQSGEDNPLMTPGKTGRIIGLFRLSYLTPGLMCAGVTEVIVEKEHEKSGNKNESNSGTADNNPTTTNNTSTSSNSSSTSSAGGGNKKKK